jgi:hypothetical protein
MIFIYPDIPLYTVNSGMSEVTTIKLKKETRERLAEIGRKKETYDDIIRRLLEFYERNSGGSHD